LLVERGPEEEATDRLAARHPGNLDRMIQRRRRVEAETEPIVGHVVSHAVLHDVDFVEAGGYPPAGAGWPSGGNEDAMLRQIKGLRPCAMTVGPGDRKRI